jgi:hypothetical protein
MRIFALAATAALTAMAMAGPASARPVSDAANRVTFELPRGWETEESNCGDGVCTFMLAFSPSTDCYIYANPRSPDQLIQAHRVRVLMRDTNVITPQIMTSNANVFSAVFPNDSATYVDSSVEENTFWPIRRVVFTNADGATVHGAFQLRRDVELWAFCKAYEGGDSASDYDTFFRSIVTPNDAAQQAEVEAAEAAQAPAAPVAAPPAN